MRESNRKPLPQGHMTRDVLNTHLNMLSASMLARVHERTSYMHALRMAFVGVRLCCPVIFYSGKLYMSINSSVSLCIDELFSPIGILENEIVSAKCSPSLRVHTLTVHTHTHVCTFCVIHTSS